MRISAREQCLTKLYERRVCTTFHQKIVSEKSSAVPSSHFCPLEWTCTYTYYQSVTANHTGRTYTSSTPTSSYSHNWCHLDFDKKTKLISTLCPTLLCSLMRTRSGRRRQCWISSQIIMHVKCGLMWQHLSANQITLKYLYLFLGLVFFKWLMLPLWILTNRIFLRWEDSNGHFDFCTQSSTRDLKPLWRHDFSDWLS